MSFGPRGRTLTSQQSASVCMALTARTAPTGEFGSILSSAGAGRRPPHHPTTSPPLRSTVGQRKADVALLSGAILPVWDNILKVVREHGRHLPKHEQALRVVRVTTDDGQRMAGIKFPAALLGQVSFGAAFAKNFE